MLFKAAGPGTGGGPGDATHLLALGQDVPAGALIVMFFAAPGGAVGVPSGVAASWSPAGSVGDLQCFVGENCPATASPTLAVNIQYGATPAGFQVYVFDSGAVLSGSAATVNDVNTTDHQITLAGSGVALAAFASAQAFSDLHFSDAPSNWVNEQSVSYGGSVTMFGSMNAADAASHTHGVVTASGANTQGVGVVIA